MGLTSSVKKPKEIEQFSGWAHLPSVVLTKIFIKLDAKDRRNASLACRTWRETYFHPRFWPFIKFSFTPGKLDEARWFTSLFGRNLKNAKVTLDTSCQLCLRAFIQLLQHLEENNNLKSLFIYPDPRTFKMPAKMSHQLRVKLVDELLASLHKCLPRLDEFGMGCGPNLPNCSLDQLLMSLNTAVLKISLCSYEKDCSELHFNPVLLRRFSKLQILRINLSQVSENLITVLLDLEALQKIILHMDNWINGNVSEIFENFKLLKRKKVEKPKEIEQFSGWAHLPSVMLTEIFDKLDAEDRRNASLVCRTWRETYFHPRFWPSIKFSFTPEKLDAARGRTSLFGRNLNNAKVTLDTTCQHCLRAFIQLLQHLEENNNLKSLCIHPDHRTLKMPAKIAHPLHVKLVDELLASLQKCLPRLDEFSIGCGPNLPNCSLDQLLMSLNTAVLKISLCSLEKDCSELQFNPVLLRRFSKLQVLRINLSQVSKDLITALLDAEALQRIILHMDKWINRNVSVSEIFEGFKLLKRKRVYIVFEFRRRLDYHEQNTDVLLLHYRQMSRFFCQILISLRNYFFDFFLSGVINILF